MTVWLKPIPHDWHIIDVSQPGLRLEFRCGLSIPYVPDAPTATTPPRLGRCEVCNFSIKRALASFLDKRLPDRFWNKAIPEPNSGCWLWTGASHPSGYGQIVWKGRVRVAHAVAFESIVGDTPRGLVLDHLCCTKSCVNPAHLEPVTFGENIRRGTSCTATNARKTNCPAGHEYSEENIAIANRSSRRCVECVRIRSRRRRAAAKARIVGVPL